MLDFVEQAAVARGMGRLVTLLTCTADWFENRGFAPAGSAMRSPLLPPWREIEGLLYSKELEQPQPLHGQELPRPGRRIGGC